MCCVIRRVNKPPPPPPGTQLALPALLHPSASTPAGEESRHSRDCPLLSLPAFLLQSRRVRAVLFALPTAPCA